MMECKKALTEANGDFDEAVKNGMIEIVSDELYERYLANVQAQTVNEGVCNGSGLKLVYSPLNGAGNKLVRKILGRIGVEDIIVVPEQEMPDPNFTTLEYPNPEDPKAFTLALKLAKEVKALGEEAKVALRNARQDAMNGIKKAEELTEDQKKSAEEDIQELINKYNKIIDEKIKEKEDELMSV